MSDRLVAAAKVRLADSMGQFRANMDDLKAQMLIMNATMRTFDRNMNVVGVGIADLGQKQRRLVEILDQAPTKFGIRAA